MKEEKEEETKEEMDDEHDDAGRSVCIPFSQLFVSGRELCMKILMQ